MTLDQLTNGLRILHSIDAYELGDPAWWPEFRDNPSRFLMRCSDERAKTIWEVMVARGAMGPSKAA